MSTTYTTKDDHTADQCRYETCERCGCCAHGKAHVIGCSTADAPVGFACPNSDCGCTGQGSGEPRITPAAAPSRRIPEEARAQLVEFAQQRIQDVWHDVGQTDALTLAQNVVAAQEFLWLSMQFPVHAARPATPSAPALEVITELLRSNPALAAAGIYVGPPTTPVDVGTSGVGTGAPGGAGEVGLGAEIRELAEWDRNGDHVLGAWNLLALADRADALERALPSHHLAEDLREATEAIERVRAQLVRMTKSSDEKTQRHGTALLHILDGDS